MNSLIEKLEKSELFPERIRDFIIQSVKNDGMNSEMIIELNKMLEEEQQAMARIDRRAT